jgi:hypothetical protein
MCRFSRRNLAELWAKSQDKSGERQPHLDERCVAAELDVLYRLLDTCKRTPNLPASIQEVLEYYQDDSTLFEDSWGEEIEAREAVTCQKCRSLMRERADGKWVCPRCG